MTPRREKTPAPKVPCPKCGTWDSRVTDGRPSPHGYRRRRKCKTCQRVFFTLEKAA